MPIETTTQTATKAKLVFDMSGTLKHRPDDDLDKLNQTQVKKLHDGHSQQQDQQVGIAANPTATTTTRKRMSFVCPVLQ